MYIKKRQKQIISACLAVTAIILFSLLSLLFIGTEIHHDCDGDDCVICETLQMCAATLKGSLGTVTVASGLAFLLPFAWRLQEAYSFEKADETLVARKIRIND